MTLGTGAMNKSQPYLISLQNKGVQDPLFKNMTTIND